MEYRVFRILSKDEKLRELGKLGDLKESPVVDFSVYTLHVEQLKEKYTFYDTGTICYSNVLRYGYATPKESLFTSGEDFGMMLNSMYHVISKDLKKGETA